MKPSIVMFVLALLCLISLAPAEKKDAAQSHDVAIKGMKFDPAEIQINVGDSVVWTNKDDRDHTVVGKGSSFKSENLGKGDTFEQKFTKAGKYSYACSYHPRMKGVVIVGGGN
jgi:plastocyanin